MKKIDPEKFLAYYTGKTTYWVRNLAPLLIKSNLYRIHGEGSGKSLGLIDEYGDATYVSMRDVTLIPKSKIIKVLYNYGDR